MLVGRDRERGEVDVTLQRSGVAATLALVGEPGIGKTALLEYAAERAAGMQLLRARGLESEAQIPFAGLLELLRPALALLERVPERAGGCARGRAGAQTGEGAGAVRDWGGDSQPAGRLRRAAAGSRPDRRCTVA